jgi:hypothetical protein
LVKNPLLQGASSSPVLVFYHAPRW